MLDAATRRCGDCDVCCHHVSISETDSPAGELCRHRKPSGCELYGYPDRPAVCSQFHCAWIRGVGADEDRPDKIGVMFSLNDTETGKFGFALEYRVGALRGPARAMTVAFARRVPFPLIVRDAESKPPDDVGDYVVVADRLLKRCDHLAGREIERLADDVGLYALIIHRDAA